MNFMKHYHLVLVTKSHVSPAQNSSSLCIKRINVVIYILFINDVTVFLSSKKSTITNFRTFAVMKYYSLVRLDSSAICRS